MAGFMAASRRKAGCRGTAVESPRSESVRLPPPAASSSPESRSRATAGARFICARKLPHTHFVCTESPRDLKVASPSFSH